VISVQRSARLPEHLMQRSAWSVIERRGEARPADAAWRAGDIVPGVVVGASEVAPGILRYLGPPASPTLLHLPVGDRIGIVALHDHRVLALVLLTIDNGLVVHVDALAGEGPRAAVSAVLGLR